MDAYDRMFEFAEPGLAEIVLPVEEEPAEYQCPSGGGLLWGVLFSCPFWLIVLIALIAWKG